MQKASEFRIVFVTCDSLFSAKAIAKALVEKKIAACCTIIQNVISVFEWEDEIEESKEYLVMIKCPASKTEELEKETLKMHNYEIPEIISVSMDEGHDKYLKWIDSCCA